MKLFSTSITIHRDIETVFNYHRTAINVQQFLPKNTTLENLNIEEGEQVQLGKAYFGKIKDNEDEFTLQFTLIGIAEFEYQLYEFKMIDWEEEEEEDFSDFMNFFNLSYRIDFKILSPNKIKVKTTYRMDGVPFWIKILMFFQLIPEYFETRRDNKKIKAEIESL